MDLNKAEVIYVKPDRVKISVSNLNDFKDAEENLQVGSYLQVIDEYEDKKLIAIIDSFSIDLVDSKENNTEFDRKYIIEASPLGVLEGKKFSRGGDTLSIPPKEVKPATSDQIKAIFEDSISEEDKFIFSKLSKNNQISIPVDGNKFFNKHIAIVGASGSGKSHTVAKVLQEAIDYKENYLNNSHIVLFDIHSEYQTAFNKPNMIDISNLTLPYWLLNDEELEELFLDTGDRNNYNQSSVLRSVITENKKKHNPEIENIFFDSPVKFNVIEVLNCLKNIANETINAKNKKRYMIISAEYEYDTSKTIKEEYGIELSSEMRYEEYFAEVLEFYPSKASNVSKGPYADGTLDKFISRIESKVHDSRYKFIFGEPSFESEFDKVLKQFIGYTDEKNSNITIIDVSGIPFEILSITVSLISRILFEFGYYKKQIFKENNTPLLVVYEEAHKYAPKSGLSKFRNSTNAIERIAKEGRKYGVSLCIVSQRPSEISETVFSQCNNFIAMRLTNPDDQNYVKRLLPDSLEGVTSSLPSLKTGEALLIGEAVIMPTIVTIDRSPENLQPSSNDIKFLKEWKKEWLNIDFKQLIESWNK